MTQNKKSWGKKVKDSKCEVSETLPRKFDL